MNSNTLLNKKAPDQLKPEANFIMSHEDIECYLYYHTKETYGSEIAQKGYLKIDPRTNSVSWVVPLT